MNSIEKLTLELIGEDVNSPDVFVEGTEDYALLRGMVNNAISELSLVTGTFHKTYHLPLLAGRFIYRMNWERDHFLYVVEAYDRARHRKLEQSDMRTIAAADPYWMKLTSGYPTHYFQIGHDCIGIYRKPSDTGRVLELRCAAIPKDYADGEPPRIRQAWQRAAAYYAVSEYYASRGDAKRATDAMEAYLELADLKRFSPGQNDTTQARQANSGNRSPQFP